MSLDYKIIGSKIKEIRKRRKLTQEQLAELIEKTQHHISYIENGKRQLSLDTFVEIANALNATTYELLPITALSEKEKNKGFATILDNCTTYEKHIIFDTVTALKQSLQANHSYRDLQ